MSRLVIVGVLIGVWVSIYAYAQGFLEQLLGIGHLELWPVLMSSSMVALLGGGKEGTRKFYAMFTTGFLSALLFILSAHVLVPYIGVLGQLIPLSIIIALVIILGKIFPRYVGAGTFIAFNAAAILTHDILMLTIARLVILFVGATIFMHVEHWIVNKVMQPAKSEIAH